MYPKQMKAKTKTVFQAKEHKGHEGIEGSPVSEYGGILIHDHDHTFYNYGSGHQECLCHVSRYLKNSIDNEKYLTWSSKMRELVQEMIHEYSRTCANPVEIAIYPKTEKDIEGNPLTGEKTYILHLDSCPPVLDGGFGSITAYGDDDFLIDNSLNRYCVNDRSGLKANADGSIDIILSKEAPEDTTNWLPVSSEGFHLFMRIYTPDVSSLENWTAPTITVK